jgi:purine-cytosine permease-like protein
MARVKFAGRVFQLPQSRLLRLLLGFAFIVMGIFGFLPVLGFWMIPVGVVILSVDSPLMRRLRRRAEVWGLRRYNRWRHGRAAGNGSNPPRS